MTTPKLLAVQPWNFNREWRGEDKPIQHTAHCCQLYMETEKNSIQLFYSHTTYIEVNSHVLVFDNHLSTFNCSEVENWALWFSNSSLTSFLALIPYNIFIHFKLKALKYQYDIRNWRCDFRIFIYLKLQQNSELLIFRSDIVCFRRRTGARRLITTCLYHPQVSKYTCRFLMDISVLEEETTKPSRNAGYQLFSDGERQ